MFLWCHNNRHEHQRQKIVLLFDTFLRSLLLLDGAVGAKYAWIAMLARALLRRFIAAFVISWQSYKSNRSSLVQERICCNDTSVIHGQLSTAIDWRVFEEQTDLLRWRIPSSVISSQWDNETSVSWWQCWAIVLSELSVIWTHSSKSILSKFLHSYLNI